MSQSWALLTDLYQLTMAYGYWKNRRSEQPTVFHLFFRNNPFGGTYTIAAGLQTAIEFVEKFHFDEDDLSYLESLTGNDAKPLFDVGFIDYLRDLELCVDIHAIDEGTVVFPNEPMLRVSGPILQCQLLETALLNIINFQSLIATKASRVVQCCRGDEVLEFGLRRAQGIDGAMAASRAAYIGGCSATSNVLAGKRYRIPVRGTHAHSWVMSFDSEVAAFQAYASAMPNNCVFLVDTYDTLDGVRHAIEIGKNLAAQGHRMVGIRLDSGDLEQLSKKARSMLDEAGLTDAKIVASNDLDETSIRQLKANHAPIQIWGVGTRLVTAFDQPALGGVYKLGAIQESQGTWRHTLKLSEQPIKTSNPGILQVRRFSVGGAPIGDMIWDELTPTAIPQSLVDQHRSDLSLIFQGNEEYEDLLRPVMLRGKAISDSSTLDAIRQRCIEQIDRFGDSLKSTRDQRVRPYVVGLEQNLETLKHQLIQRYHSTSNKSQRTRTALIIVDLQYDFIEGGALAVPRGSDVIHMANLLMQHFDFVVATQDWHPANHQSFVSQHPDRQVGDQFLLDGLEQIVWPVHCVQGTRGAELVAELNKSSIDAVIRKGTNPRCDSYSGFFDNGHQESTGLANLLWKEGIRRVAIVGLATDYCVRHTALDAVREGFEAVLLEDACRGVELKPGDIEYAMDEMRRAGVRISNSQEWIYSRI